MRLSISTAIYMTALVLCQDNTEQDEGTCSTTKEECQDPAEEKEKYEKLKWTNDYDYHIREKLDAADDLIGSDRQQAVTMFQEILADHPDSNRALYSLARTYVIRMHEANQTTEVAENCQLARERLYTILAKEGNLEIMDNSAANLLLHIADSDLCFYHEDLLEALGVLRRPEPEGRYAQVLCHELLMAGHFQRAVEESENILSNKPTEFLLNIIKSTAMKMMGQHKEANRFLRSIDFDEAADTLTRDEIIMDINHICTQLNKRGNQTTCQTLAKDASRLHLVPSALQRPLDHRPALKAQPVWEVSEVRPRNRWTNVQSITGIGLTSQSLNTFSENFNTILEEASNLTEELEESWTPITSKKSSYMLPFFLYGKKKHEICSRASKTCKLLKKFKDSSSCRKCISRLVLLRPGARPLTYCGPTNTKLRAVLPLSLTGAAGLTVAGNTVAFQAGELLVYDDSFENSFWTESDQDVLLMSIDFHHPDLSDRQKRSDTFTEYVKNKFMTY